MGHARNRGSRGWVTARGHPAPTAGRILRRSTPAGLEVFGVGACDVDCATVEIWSTTLKRLNEHWRVVRATLRYSSAMTWAMTAPIRSAAASMSLSARWA